MKLYNENLMVMKYKGNWIKLIYINNVKLNNLGISAAISELYLNFEHRLKLNYNKFL